MIDRKPPALAGGLRLAKIPFGAFRQFLAVCCAHNWYAIGVPIPHLQPDLYFVSGTRPDTKCFWILFSAYAENSARLFYILSPSADWQRDFLW